VDRRALGAIVFADPDARARLNAISHPRLLALAQEALRKAGEDGFRGLVVFEAALLVEWDVGDWCDEVVVVRAPETARRARAARALGVSEEEAARRIAAQLPDEVRVRYADRVLDNDDTLEEWERRARELADALWAAWRARENPAPTQGERWRTPPN
jgi:dephospho-CoA kinase